MLSIGRYALIVFAALASLPAQAATVELFAATRGGRIEVSPRVAYNPESDDFLVVATSDLTLRSGRSGPGGGEQGAWARSSQTLAENWRDTVLLSYNPTARAFLVAGSSSEYLRLDGEGVVQSRHELEGGDGPTALAATWIDGTPNWFLLVQDCKYGCFTYGHIVGPGGDVLESFDLLFPLADRYPNFRRKWQVGYDPDSKTFLALWEDGFDNNSGGPSRAIRGQRFQADGLLVGGRIEIASHPREASQPHMVYHSERGEWLVVYRRGKNVKGLFLRGGRSTPFRIGEPWIPAMRPSIAYSPVRDTYLVTWVQWGDSAGIYGRWMRADGKTVGGPFAVDDPEGDQWVFAPGNSACNDSGACLVTWINDGEDGTVRGHYLRVP